MSESKRHDEIQGEIIHTYDGIEEADNMLPRWWLLTFYGAIVFAIGYWFYYHEYQVGMHQPEVYAQQMRDRAAQGGDVDADTLEVLAQDTSTVEAGRETFASNCAACHGDRGQGHIGPNLTDDAWLHGGDPVAIYTTVRNGVTEQGMPAWGPALGEGPVQAVVAYLMSVRGTNEEGGRPPEGDPYDPSATTPQAPAPAGEEAPAAAGEEAAPEEARAPGEGEAEGRRGA